MPNWVKTIFLFYLPLFLMMPRPRPENHEILMEEKQNANKNFKKRSTKQRIDERGRKYVPGEFIEMSQVLRIF